MNIVKLNFTSHCWKFFFFIMVLNCCIVAFKVITICSIFKLSDLCVKGLSSAHLEMNMHSCICILKKKKEKKPQPLALCTHTRTHFHCGPQNQIEILLGGLLWGSHLKIDIMLRLKKNVFTTQTGKSLKLRHMSKYQSAYRQCNTVHSLSHYMLVFLCGKWMCKLTEFCELWILQMTVHHRYHNIN